MATANPLNISLQPKQLEAYVAIEDGAQQYLFYGGAKFGGKSYFVRAKEISRRIKYPGTTGVIIRKTYPELLANHIRKIWIEYPITRKWYKASEKAIYYPNGSVTEFKYLQGTDDVYNYQGIEYDDITLDEATQHEEEVFKILKTSLRSDPKVMSMNPHYKKCFLMTGNPGGIGHNWVKRLFVKRDFNPNETPEDYNFIPAKYSDNEIGVAANPEYVKNLFDLPEDLRRAYLDGDWDIFIGQFFKDWRDDIHVIDPISVDPEWGKMFGVDWGFYPHPFHIGWYAKDFDGNILKYREATDIETPPDEVGKLIVKMSKEDKNLSLGVGDTQMWTRNPFQRPAKGEAYSDKSIADQINSVLSERDLYMYKANKDRINGWTELRSLMKWDADLKEDGRREFKRRPKYYVFSTCKATIAAYPDMIHSELRPEDMLKQDGDDPCDTDRYAIMAIKAGIKTVRQPDGDHDKVMQKVLGYNKYRNEFGA